MEINASSLEDILAARENREKMRMNLIKEYQGTLVAFTLNTPGPIKNSPEYGKVFEEGVRLMTEALDQYYIRHQQMSCLPTGPEAYVCTDESAAAVKLKLAELEERHPLGRLFDYDVFDSSCNKLSRIDAGLPERRCLLCEEKAFICARSRRHDSEELLASIKEIVNIYFNN